MAVFHWTKESERHWDDRAENWNSRSKKMWENGSRKEIIPFFQTYVDKGKNVCDLGCGDGYGSLKLTEAGYIVTGIDVSGDMLKKAELVNSTTSARFLKGDMENIPAEEGAFDAVLAINSLEWTEDPLRVLNEMKRVIKKEGKACIGILGPTAGPRANSYERLYGRAVVCNTMMPWELERLATENGWKKLDELIVYKKEAKELVTASLSPELKQALSFMSVFMFEKSK